jgi:hypothetical protein
MDAIRNVRNAERIGSPSADNSATAQKKEALCKFLQTPQLDSGEYF